jgi:hypothetical protein
MNDDYKFLIALLIVLTFGICCACFCDRKEVKTERVEKKDDIYLTPIVVPGSNGDLECYLIPTSY